MESSDKQVSQLAIRRLNSLFQYVSSDSLKPKLAKLREDFLSMCMQYLADSVQQLSGNTQNSECRENVADVVRIV